MSRALVLTYHAIEPGPPPLCVEPALFAQHLDAIAAAGATVLTVRALAAALRDGRVPERAVAITFDDGYASAASNAAPLLSEHGLVATMFCVARWLGRSSDWPSQAGWATPRPLADGEELASLAAAGWELGSHGLDHSPLADASQFGESRALLEQATGAEVRSFAYPYGVVPPGAPAALAAGGYEAACTTRAARVGMRSDPLSLPRVDAHYLRQPQLLRAAVAGRLDAYLRGRAAAAAIRRLARKDHVVT